MSNGCFTVPPEGGMAEHRLKKGGYLGLTARDVGNVMALNRFSLIVPCHRVLLADGRLGDFSAPQGTKMEERLQAMERL